jgi:putative protease
MAKKEEGKLIGKISHYFSNIGVAVIELSDALKAGDKIRIVGGETDFEQVVDSMEVDHKKVDKAKKKEGVGLKVDQKVREGYKVFKV